MKHPSKLRKKTKYQYFSLFEVKLHRIKAENISFERTLKTASSDVFYLFHMFNFFGKNILFFEKRFLFFCQKNVEYFQFFLTALILTMNFITEFYRAFNSAQNELSHKK